MPLITHIKLIWGLHVVAQAREFPSLGPEPHGKGAVHDECDLQAQLFFCIGKVAWANI